MSASPATVAVIKSLQESGSLTHEIIEGFRAAGELTTREAAQLSAKLAKVSESAAKVSESAAKVSESAAKVKLPTWPRDLSNVTIGDVKVDIAAKHAAYVDAQGRPGLLRAGRISVKFTGSRAITLTSEQLDALAKIAASEKVRAMLAASQAEVDALRDGKAATSSAAPVESDTL